MQIFMFKKSGNLVTIQPNSEYKSGGEVCVSVDRINCNKQMIVPVKSLIKLEDALKDGVIFCNSDLRKIKSINPNFELEQYL
jgi:hypothetical protein